MKEDCLDNFTSKYSWEIVDMRILRSMGLAPAINVRAREKNAHHLWCIHVEPLAAATKATLPVNGTKLNLHTSGCKILV